MGWSYTLEAGRTMDAMEALCRESTGTQNGWIQRTGSTGTRSFFYEIEEREREDDTVHGEVWETRGDNALRISSFVIGPDGTIRRGGYMPRVAAGRIGKGDKIDDRDIVKNGGK